MGVVTKRAAPFVWFRGMRGWEKQSSFLPQLTDQQEPSLARVLG